MLDIVYWWEFSAEGISGPFPTCSGGFGKHLAIFSFLLCLGIVTLFIIMAGPMLNQSPVSLGANRGKDFSFLQCGYDRAAN